MLLGINLTCQVTIIDKVNFGPRENLYLTCRFIFSTTTKTMRLCKSRLFFIELDPVRKTCLYFFAAWGCKYWNPVVVELNLEPPLHLLYALGWKPTPFPDKHFMFFDKYILWCFAFWVFHLLVGWWNELFHFLVINNMSHYMWN